MDSVPVKADSPSTPLSKTQKSTPMSQDTPPNTDNLPADKNVDRSFIGERNKRIVEVLQKGRLSYEQIALHFGMSRKAIKMIAYNIRKFPDADPKYLASPYAQPYSVVSLARAKSPSD